MKKSCGRLRSFPGPFKIMPLLILVFCLSISGCGVSERYVASVPIAESNEITLTDLDILQHPKLGLSVKPFNARLTSTFNVTFFLIPLPFSVGGSSFQRFGKEDMSASPPFFIEVAFNATTEDVLFDPAQVTLLLAGQEYKPTGVIMPSAFRPLRRFGGGARPTQCITLCQIEEYPYENKFQPLQHVQVPKGGRACTMLRFDVAPPLPESEFSLSLNGIHVAGERVILPPIRFTKGTRSHNDSVM